MSVIRCASCGRVEDSDYYESGSHGGEDYCHYCYQDMLNDEGNLLPALDEPLEEESTGAPIDNSIDAIADVFLEQHPEFAGDIAKLKQEFPTDAILTEFISQNISVSFPEKEIDDYPFIGHFDESDVTSVDVVFESFSLEEGKLSLTFLFKQRGETICYATNYVPPEDPSTGTDDAALSEMAVSIEVSTRVVLLFPANISALDDYEFEVDKDSQLLEY